MLIRRESMHISDFLLGPQMSKHLIIRDFLSGHSCYPNMYLCFYPLPKQICLIYSKVAANLQ